MSRAELTPVSYVVLGLVARDGPSTPYDLKAAVGRGIAHFWPFPHSQIYSETEQLARTGLLLEEREDWGRRRRTYRITAAGKAALAEWLAAPTVEAPQIRSLGMLKLYFGAFGEPADLARLASEQVEVHRQGLAQVEQLLERLRARPERRWQLEVAAMFLDVLSALTQQWERIEKVAGEQGSAGRAG